MGLLDRLLGWNRKARRLRKRWDRLREKALKKGRTIRMAALKKLDAINLNLTTLEEQQLTRSERARLMKIIEIDLAEVRGLMESKPSEIVNEVRTP